MPGNKKLNQRARDREHAAREAKSGALAAAADTFRGKAHERADAERKAAAGTNPFYGALATAGTQAQHTSRVVTAQKSKPAASAMAAAARDADAEGKRLGAEAVELEDRAAKFKAAAAGRPDTRTPPPKAPAGGAGPAAAAEVKAPLARQTSTDLRNLRMDENLYAGKSALSVDARDVETAARAAAGRNTSAELIGRMVLQILDEIDSDIKDVQKYQTSDINTPLGKGKNDTMVTLAAELKVKRDLLPKAESLRKELKEGEEEAGKNLLSDSKRFDLEKYRAEVEDVFTKAETQLTFLVTQRSASNLGDFKGNVGLCGEAIDRAKMKFGDVIRILEIAKGKVAQDSKKPSGLSLFSENKAPAPQPQVNANEHLVRWLDERVKGMKKAYGDLEGESGENYVRLKECLRHVDNILNKYKPVLNSEQRFLHAISSLAQAYERNMRKREKTIMSRNPVSREEYNGYAKGLNNAFSVHHHYSRMLGLVLKNAVNMYHDTTGRSLQADLGRSEYRGASVLDSVQLIDDVSRKEYAFLKEAEASAAPKPRH